MSNNDATKDFLLSKMTPEQYQDELAKLPPEQDKTYTSIVDSQPTQGGNIPSIPPKTFKPNSYVRLGIKKGEYDSTEAQAVGRVIGTDSGITRIAYIRKGYYDEKVQLLNWDEKSETKVYQVDRVEFDIFLHDLRQAYLERMTALESKVLEAQRELNIYTNKSEEFSQIFQEVFNETTPYE